MISVGREGKERLVYSRIVDDKASRKLWTPFEAMVLRIVMDLI
jgi:hypothetical protein